MKRIGLLSTILLFLAAAILHARDTEVHDGHDVSAKQAILQIDLFKYQAQLPAILQQLAALGGADDLRPLNKNLGIYVMHSRSNNVTALLNVLKTHPAVSFVEPDFVIKVSATPNDPNFSQQWDMFNSVTAGADIGATLAWNVSTGSTANVVGVVDTGIDFTHPDLAANVWAAPSAFTVSLSFGQITCPAGSHGYNAIARTCSPADDNGHGTHVSGTIGAIGNNGTGVAGVNWTTRIMALKFLDSTGTGSTSDAIDAIEFGLQAKTIFGSTANLRVLSNSWGGGGFSQALLNEINKANTADVLFVVAAGNAASNNDTTPTYPASFNAPNIVSVAATTSTDSLAGFSNFGRTSVHLGAPGVNILSTLPNVAYGFLSGTSMATPHVAGAAMLVLSKCTLSTAGLKNALLANVDAIASLQGITVTGGRLNVNKAIHNCAPAPSGSAAFVRTDSTTQGNWRSVYGADGFSLALDGSQNPAYGTAAVSGQLQATWAASTTDVRALQKAANPADRIAAIWWTTSSFTIDVNLTDGVAHQVAIYALDWDSLNRNQRVEVLDGGSGFVLDTRNVGSFSGGQYLVWSVSGHVQLRVTNTGTVNAVVSGLFFGGPAAPPPPPSSTAQFVKTDSTTQGNWRSGYGADGFNLALDGAQNPAYGTVAVSGQSQATWAASTTDVRALQKVANPADRIAAIWWTTSSFTLDVNLTDSAVHQVAIYALDWDSLNRNQRVDVIDVASSTVLDTRNAASFAGGQYLVWNIKGHVQIRVTNNPGSVNAVVSGVFFGGPAAPPPPPSSTVVFVKTDSTTQGNWRSGYGADGFNLALDGAQNPAYGTVAVSGQFQATWAASTTDVRALQKAANPADRIAAIWWSTGSFTIDANLTDSLVHQVAIYALDWDSFNRTQRIDVIDAATGTVLDTRSVSSFAGGQYLVWNIKGHVQLRVTNTSPVNAVVSGVFFGGPAAPPPPPSSTAVFVKTDSTTQGNWRSGYGADGFNLALDGSQNPVYGTAAVSGQFQATWAASTTDVRALQKAANPADRIAAIWWSTGSFTIDVNLTDSLVHQVAIYALDWDSFNRTQRIDVIDAATGTVLDTRNVSSFAGGQYLVWNIKGHVQLRVTNTSPVNAVVSGVFFGGPAAPPPPPSSTAQFVKTDLTTQGNWRSAYGADGFNLALDGSQNPAYGTVAVSGQFQATWAASTTDVRALQKVANPADRIAAIWWSTGSFTIDVNLTGSVAHQVAIYALDWDSFNRTQRIDVIDAATGTVLDTRNVSSFAGGQYLVWNIKGHVQIRVTNTSPVNAVVSGVFFG